ncbi:MAG TPA: EVE domain-containing protein [Devosiaceae bacterium]|jgi:predicted RNA-binding protein with PUA-like domain|nr:EVE domain-containing protein [Devosiaceae bacterium]
MAYWLMKSEPDTFGWDDLVKMDKPEEWTGVRNYAARNNMRAMQVGEECFFYHSVQGKEVVGIMRVVQAAHPDSTADLKDGKAIWECVDVVADRPLQRPVTLEEMKTTPGLEDMVLINNSRLSVQPVTEEEWKIVCRLGGL